SKSSTIVSNDITKLLNTQFGEDGGQLLELKRTKAQQYSIANLRYWLDIKSMVNNANLKFSDKQNQTFSQGFNYLKKGGKVSDESHNQRYYQMESIWKEKNFFSRIFSSSNLDVTSLENAIFVLTRQ